RTRRRTRSPRRPPAQTRPQRARTAPRRPPTSSEELDGEDVTEGPPAADAEVQDAAVQPLQALRPAARVLPQVRPLPHLPAGDGPRGLRPGTHEVELVAACR